MSTSVDTRGKGKAKAQTATCKAGTRFSRSAAVIEARRLESGRARFRAYRCATCLQPNGTAAWHVRRLSLWRRLLTSDR